VVVREKKVPEMNADGFLHLVRKYTDIIEVTPTILSEFIDKIAVHHREKLFGETVQRVEIYYKMIGYVELPEMNAVAKERHLASFGRDDNARMAV